MASPYSNIALPKQKRILWKKELEISVCVASDRSVAVAVRGAEGLQFPQQMCFTYR